MTSLGILGASALLDAQGVSTIGNFADLNGQVYNVKAYGALGNGVSDDTSAINSSITAATKTGGIVFFPPGTYRISSTLSFGLGQSGMTFAGAGRYYSSKVGSILKWTGSSGGTMIKLDACNRARFHDFTIEGNSLAGIGIQLVSSASSTASNSFDRLLMQNFSGSPGRAIEIGVTAVANVSENYFSQIKVYSTATPFYQDGAQTFTWLDKFLATNATDCMNVRNGWLTVSNSECGGTGNALRIGVTGSKVRIDDFDWEGTGTFMISEDTTNYNFVSVNNLRALYDANGTPGTIIQIGTSAGACGTYDFTDCKFSTAYSNSQATIAIIQNSGGARVVFSDPGTTYLTSPSATVKTYSGSVYHSGGVDELATTSTAPTGSCSAGLNIARDTGKLYVCESGSWVVK